MKNSSFANLNLEKESPPMWTRETYRPPHSNYSLCCPILGGGLTRPWWGSVPHPWWGYPILGTVLPCPDLVRGYPGVPPERTWDQWKYYGMKMGYPPPPGVDWQTNWKYSLGSYFVRGRQKCNKLRRNICVSLASRYYTNDTKCAIYHRKQFKKSTYSFPDHT